jgi:selenium-dependent xanthine dehydrogenase
MVNKIITLNVNGMEYELPAIPGESVADLLRNRLNLMGTKIGCNEAECGACTVVIDSKAILSCVYPAERAQGKKIITIEGLVKRNGTAIQLHPLQEAFILHGAVQCGFCIPGQLMTSFALLQHNPSPTSDEIRDALKDTLCRCAGYPSIESAIQAAADSLRTGQPVICPDLDITDTERKVIGHNQVRPDAKEKVTGMAIYTDDLKFKDMLFASVKRAGVPHAFIRHLDVEKAKKLEGVSCVLTAKDIPGDQNHGLVIPDWPSIVGVGERIRYVGDAVAIVAAETQEIARQALDLIQVEFDKLRVVSDPVQAHQPDAPLLHKNGNLLKHIKVRKGDMEEGFLAADVILEHTFYTPITEHAFIEPECSIAVPTADGRMEIHVGSQIPYADREQVAHALGWEKERVRVIGRLVGGGFGGKEDIMGQIHAALLANATGRPVKLLFDRHESMLVHPKRHATRIRVKVGAKSNGKLTAVETELYGDTGAYASLGEKVMTRATTHSAGPYEVPNVKADCYAMYTNNPPAGAFRGFGVLQSAFAVESMMDMLALTLNLDAVEIRRINALKVGSITNTGQELRDSVGLIECIDKVKAEVVRQAGPDAFLPKCVNDEKSRDGKKVRAWGFAAAYKNTGLGGGADDKSGAEVELYSDGTVEVRTSAAELGQGLVTVLQMIVSEELNVKTEKVRVLLMDTDLTPDGGPTTASRQTYVTGNAARLAARSLRQAIATSFAEKYDIPNENIVFIEGYAQINKTKIPIGSVVKDLQENGQKARAKVEYWAPETKPLGEKGDMHFAFAFAAQAAEVEVNTQTGEVKVLKVISANDVGHAINPMGLKGQVEGGIMMGLGHALTEEFIVNEGIVVTDRLARYRIPSISQTPNITSFIVEHPTSEGPYGAKGVGEIVSIPTVPAITNAIFNATGVRIDKLPVDQETIIWEMKKKNE